MTKTVLSKFLQISLAITISLTAYSCWLVKGYGTANTWYIRDGGGSVYGMSAGVNTCNGLYNVVYSSGASPNCALNHPDWLLGVNGQAGGSAISGLMASGDTAYIDGDSDITPGAQAQYLIGTGMPQTPGGGCNNTYGYTCSMNDIPDGADSSHKTTIIGTGIHQPQFYGTQAINHIIGIYPASPPVSGTLTVVAGHGSGTSPITFTASQNVIYSFTVSGVTTAPAVGDIYTNNGDPLTVVSRVISGGSGTITTSTPNYNGSPSLVLSQQTLARVSGSGDASIAYSGYLFSTFGFTVSGVSSPPAVGDEYTTGGKTFDVRAVVLNGTSGSILFEGEDNVDLENIEITQHDSCTYIPISSTLGVDGFPATCLSTSGNNYPWGPWALRGISMEGMNITTKNLWIHRIAKDDIWIPGLIGNWSASNDKFTSSGEALDNGIGAMGWIGTNTMNTDIWAWGGALEHYPTPDPGNVKDPSNYVNGCDDDCHNGALGGGFMQQADSGPCGIWTITNSQFLFNLKTNIDFLHCDGAGTFNMYRSRSEGSSGEALKVRASAMNIEESQLLGNAPVWSTSPISSVYTSLRLDGSSTGGAHICRGQAVINLYTTPSESANFVNDDITGNCTSLFVTSSPTDQCAGMSINSWNTKLIGGYFYPTNGQNVDLVYFGGTTGNNDGPCGTTTAIPFNQTNDSCYGAHTYGGFGCSSGTNTVSSDPLILGESTIGAFTNWLGPTAYYSGTNMGDIFYLQSGSPLATGGSTSGVTYTNGTTHDYNNFVNPDSSPIIPIGAIYTNSCITTSTDNTTNGFCSINNQCCSGVCNGSDFCASSCTINGGACSGGGTCCSGLCSASQCVAYICGDGIMPEGAKVCDITGPNLNGQTCVTQGFTGGPLGCNSNCLSFNTSSCTGGGTGTTGSSLHGDFLAKGSCLIK